REPPVAGGAVTPAEALAGLEGCSIAPDGFGHDLHVAATWQALAEEALPAAAARICTALRRFAARAGKAHRYHETITWAFLVLIAERRHRLGAGASWARFRAAFPEVFDPGLLNAYYGDDLLSDVAREVFVLPRRP